MIYAKYPPTYFLPILFVLFLTISVSGQNEIVALELDVPIEREISKGEIHKYKIQAQKGDFVRVVASQQNADITMRAVASDNRKLFDANVFAERGESERVSFVAEESGEFVFEIEFFAALRGQLAGKSYRLRLAAHCACRRKKTERRSLPKIFMMRQSN